MDRILMKEEVLASTGLSDSTLDRMEKNGTFPSRRKLSAKRVGWIDSEINDWILSREPVFKTPLEAQKENK